VYRHRVEVRRRHWYASVCERVIGQVGKKTRGCREDLSGAVDVNAAVCAARDRGTAVAVLSTAAERDAGAEKNVGLVRFEQSVEVALDAFVRVEELCQRRRAARVQEVVDVESEKQETDVGDFDVQARLVAEEHEPVLA
jgi:hypothetical protein